VIAETPEQKFTRLATIRADNAEKAIELLGNLSGKHYGWTQESVQAMFASIVRTLGASLARFKADARWTVAEKPVAAPEPAQRVQEAAPITTHDGILVQILQRVVRQCGAREVEAALQWVIGQERQRNGADA
jgi:hypothetical protein